MAASEEVLLMINNVKHRKVEGTMFMMDRRMAWQQRGKESFHLSHMYADIKCQKVSPEGKEKIQLQVYSVYMRLFYCLASSSIFVSFSVYLSAFLLLADFSVGLSFFQFILVFTPSVSPCPCQIMCLFVMSVYLSFKPISTPLSV